MFCYWQNKKLKLTYFEVGFIGGFTPKKPTGFFLLCTRVSEPCLKSLHC